MLDQADVISFPMHVKASQFDFFLEMKPGISIFSRYRVFISHNDSLPERDNMPITADCWRPNTQMQINTTTKWIATVANQLELGLEPTNKMESHQKFMKNVFKK